MVRLSVAIEVHEHLQGLGIAVAVAQPPRTLGQAHGAEREGASEHGLHEQRQAPAERARQERAHVVDPHAGHVPDDVAGELDARELAAVLGGRDLALVRRHDHAQEADAKARDNAADDHRVVACRERLHEAAEREGHGAPHHHGLASEAVRRDAAEQRRDQRADLEDRDHRADLRGARLVEVRAKVRVRQDAAHDALVVAEHEHAETREARHRQHEARAAEAEVPC